MALTTTSLASPFTATGESFYATAATGATVGGFARIDGEFSVITEIVGTRITVRSRGDYGGTAVAHNILAPVTFGLQSDLSQLGVLEMIPVPTQKENMVTIGADGVIPVPNRDTVYVIMKGSALATSTLADPSKSQDGLQVTFIGGTEFAHVVTGINVWNGAVGVKTTLTSAAVRGSSLTLMAYKGTWLARSNNLWVIT